MTEPAADDSEHFSGEMAPYRRACPRCGKDLTGLCLVLKTPEGKPLLVAEPCKCRFCGALLLYGMQQSPVIRP